jgi:hypothetical protein
MILNLIDFILNGKLNTNSQILERSKGTNDL